MSKYYCVRKFLRIIGVSIQTLRNWDANVKLQPHHTTTRGYRYYFDEQLNHVMNVKPKDRITIGYLKIKLKRLFCIKTGFYDLDFWFQ